MEPLLIDNVPFQDSTHLIDCSVVQTHDQEDLTTEGCIAVLVPMSPQTSYSKLNKKLDHFTIIVLNSKTV